MYKERTEKTTSKASVSNPSPEPYEAISRHNFKQNPKISACLSEEEIFNIDVVSTVLPFKANNFVVNQLINWKNHREDPIFRLVFPQKEMLFKHDFNRISKLITGKADSQTIVGEAMKIRERLNPHPAGQLDKNIPQTASGIIEGIQHKYRETVLFFPSQGQTCHAYCTFCFRWPQFIRSDAYKISSKETGQLIEYLRKHPKVTDLLITGGDPMVMKTSLLESYILPVLQNVPTIRNIRIGTKSLTYWPFRFTHDDDSTGLLDLFREIKDQGRHLAIMGHFNHPQELENTNVQEAITAVTGTGAQIRTQSPLLRHINDDPKIWVNMWKAQVSQGCIPYYMFIARNTGAQHYFAVTLERAWNIFRDAYQQVSGICRTVRGPSMSAMPGKVQVLGVSEIAKEKAFVLRFLQGRDPDWVNRPFFAKYDPEAIWFTELKPLRGRKFFYQA